MYLLNTPEDIQAMLQTIGVTSIEDLFASIPEPLRLSRDLNIPPSLSEMELTNHLTQLAKRNQSAGDGLCFLGGGSYDHFIPAVIDAIVSRSEYYTAYTPYQAEASQGSLQAFFEYQTLMCQLTGMDVSNASLYEGGSAVAEAVIMAMAIKEYGGKEAQTPEKFAEVLVAESMHPEYRQVLATYLTNLPCRIKTIATPDGYLSPEALRKAIGPQSIAVVVQHPNFFGGLEQMNELTTLAHEHQLLMIQSFDPISLGLLKGPGTFGVDIAVAEGQSLGTPMSFGGPYLGVLTCRQEYVRKIPGRLVGQTVDRRGNRCWVLTLQTREQHIRRDKATSNICTNQGLFALRAAIYLAALGPQGLKETADHCIRKSHYCLEQLCKIPGVSLAFSLPFFKEFTVRLPVNVSELLTDLLGKNIHGGLDLSRWYPQYKNHLTIAVTENRTREQIDQFIAAAHSFITKAKS